VNKALIVAINDYDPPSKLNGCIRDGIDMESFVTLSCGFEPMEVFCIKDRDATADYIREGMRWLAEGVRPYEDRILWHFSGHGSQLRRGDASTDVICPVDFDGSPQRAIGADEIRDVFKGIPVGVPATFVADCCHSGDLVRGIDGEVVSKCFVMPDASVAREMAADHLSLRDVSETSFNLALISGCRSDQTSADAKIGGSYNGALTYHLIDILRMRDGLKISLVEAIERVRVLLRKKGYTQIPQLHGPHSITSRPFLARTAAGTCEAGTSVP
jgi:hypothetical protein